MTPVLTQTQRLLKLGCGIMLLEESEHPTLNEQRCWLKNPPSRSSLAMLTFLGDGGCIFWCPRRHRRPSGSIGPPEAPRLRPEWWRIDRCLRSPCHDSWPGCAANGGREASGEGWFEVSSLSWCFEVDAQQDLARSRDWGPGGDIDIYTLLHRFVFCNVLCPGKGKWRRAICTGRGDMHNGCRN